MERNQRQSARDIKVEHLKCQGISARSARKNTFQIAAIDGTED